MYLIRLIIIGDSSVGKTSLLVRFHEDNFITTQKTTIGVDYKAKEICIDDEEVKLQIWDTAGQERFRSMTSAFYSKAQGIIITFDVTNLNSFRAIPNWIRDVNMYAPSFCSIVLVANKVDMPPEKWAVSQKEYITFAGSNNLKILECSAASGQNVNEAFIAVSRIILTKNRGELSIINSNNGGVSQQSKLKLDTNKRKERSCC